MGVFKDKPKLSLDPLLPAFQGAGTGRRALPKSGWGESICASPISQKGSASRIHEELSQLKNKKTTYFFFKTRKGSEKTFPEEGVYTKGQ